MTDGLAPFAFATVTSRGYVDQTAGLLLNLREYYPDTKVVVCALDDLSREAFERLADPHQIIATGEGVWGADHWRNMHARMNRAERAFATKSALSAWTLANVADSMLLLDSDLLFLDRVDDLIAELSEHAALLVTGRHGIDEWEKAGRFGLFSAGVIGLTRRVLRAVRIWKASCFESCSAAPMAGAYYEQKYLDPFLNIPGVALVHDPGINISQTFLKLLAPSQAADGTWQVRDGTRIRIFHASRSSDTSFKLYQYKADYNRRGLERIEGGARKSEARQDPGPEASVARLLRRISVGRIVTRLTDGLPTVMRRMIEIYRALTLRELTFSERLRETLTHKRALLATLREEAGEPKGSDTP